MDRIADQSEELLERLLFTIDKGKAGDIERDGLKQSLLTLKDAYETMGPHQTLAEQKRRKRLLQKMQANTAERRKLRQQLGPYGKQEIARARWLQVGLKPTLKAMKDFTPTESGKSSIEAQVLEKREEFKKLEQLEEAEDLCIGILIKEMQATYKKAPIRKVVVEPFLLILGTHNKLKSAQPLTDVMKALFDWLGIEKNCRPTDVGIRTIAHEIRRKILPSQNWIFAKGRKLVKIYDWRTRDCERRLEAARRARARTKRLLKIMTWRLKDLEDKSGLAKEALTRH